MATTMDSPTPYDDSPMDQDDVVYPCKGCGEILEEGKAFELAGNRWHIDCFRCHTCGTLLDSDANLLLLGDGSLICNNCTYSCSACGNKIEDLAILTGDQAFCAGCFRCRSCKRKIDNLRYARTSQGIFCMSCHESLMARRRKKAKAKPASTTPSAAPAVGPVEKALPSLPPGAAHDVAFSPDIETPPADSTSSPSQRYLHTNKSSSISHKRDVSPLPEDAHKDDRGRLASSQRDDIVEDGDPEEGFLPMAFDPNPAPRIPQLSRKRVPHNAEDSSPAARVEGQASRDYFTGKVNDRSHRDRDRLRDEPSISSRSASVEPDGLQNQNQNQTLSPHIAYQDKNRTQKRTASGQNTPGSITNPSPSPATGPVREAASRPKIQTAQTSSHTLGSSENFKLQDVPKDRKHSAARGASKASSRSPASVSPVKQNNKSESTSDDVSPISQDSGVNPFDDPKLKEASPSVPAPVPPRHADRPARGDSLAASAASNLKTSSKRSTPDAGAFKHIALPTHDRKESISSVHTPHADRTSSLSRDVALSKALESPRLRASFDGPPPRSSSRPSAPSSSGANDEFIAPRAPPPPPAIPSDLLRNRESTSTLHSSEVPTNGQPSPAMRSAGLPKYTTDSAFSMEKEMSRIMRGERGSEDNENPSSVLRKVSNAVRHGRSLSDRAQHAKVPPNGAVDSSISSPLTISSPIMSSPTSNDSIDSLRAQLRRAQQRIAELQAEKLGLEDKVNSSTEIRQVNSELREKRTTMAFLDTQREIVVRELETMTHHLQKAKDKTHPLDLPTLKSDMLEDFSASLQKLKDHVGSQIEDLMRRRNELTDEITNLIQMKDKGFQEYESLSNKNAQLVEMNNQLLHSIQDNFKANRGQQDGKANGLGIYQPSTTSRAETPGSTDVRNLNLVSTDSSMPNLLQENDAEPATVLTAPQVVNIRKGQPKKFNWRKGGERVAKGVTKGIKGAFAAGDKPGIEANQIGMPYSQTQQQATPGSEMSSLYSKQGVPPGAGFGFFKNGKPGQMGNMKDYSGTTIVTVADPSTLFGSDLEARCEYENRIVPGIVTRCIAEVESRGMQVEGIYRKSGGSGQVKSVQAGFEKDTNFDISDPDLEIHAVTSTLKQYFRKLPTPLITYDVYDSLLDAGSVSDRERQAIALRHAIAELPEHHHGCLEYLIRHLARVMKLEKDNLMTPLNLAVVFAPTIMRPLSIEREMSDGLAQRAAVQALLEQHEFVFADE